MNYLSYNFISKVSHIFSLYLVFWGCGTKFSKELTDFEEIEHILLEDKDKPKAEFMVLLCYFFTNWHIC